ncbi:hypothetical protein [Streptomyces sp. NPDC101115]|uniref:hypothetical protein n=1 Tax=Streptomyces sp. NPDC101115 TaxID=3366106 RepID=UPI003814C0A1
MPTCCASASTARRASSEQRTPTRALVTCGDGNIASARTIERDRGGLQDVRETEVGLKRSEGVRETEIGLKRRYRIEL